jgi:hypothetical protein
MQITSFEKYEEILRSPYNNSPIDIDIGFYGLCSYQPQAWDYVFFSIRQYYPDSPIVLINDGTEQYDYSEIAKKYNCIHIVKEREICLHYPDIEGSYEFLNRTLEACNLCKTEWMIHLHPDVICQGKISYHPNAHLAGVGCGSNNGISNNNWNNMSISVELKKVETYIRKFQPTVELNGWGWCGGSIMYVDAFKTVYNSVIGENSIFKLEDIRKDSWLNVTEHEDTMMSVLFALNGFVFRIWKDNPEYHRGSKEGAFLHGFKEHYDFKKQGLTAEEYFTKVRTQQIHKSEKSGLLQGKEYSRTNYDEKYLHP